MAAAIRTIAAMAVGKKARVIDLVIVLIAIAGLPAAEDADLRARASLARQLARESNDRELIATAERVVAGQGGEDALRELEGRVGIEPGGWSMHGLPVFRPLPGDNAALPGLQAALKEALAAQDAARITAAVAGLRALFGERAGLPDMRRRGWRPPPGADGRPPPPGADGRPPPPGRQFAELAKSSPMRRALLARACPAGAKVREITALLDALTALRLAAAQQPEVLADLDRLREGAAGILLDLQRPEGFWPFPDLREVNVRFGGMIEEEIARNGNRVEGGWLVGTVANGGSCFDTGLAGQALLRAGAQAGRAEWTAAGLKAATWAARGALSTNWNYNAFAAGLCADAARLGGDAALLDAAVRFADLGVRPGQLADGPNRGRWLDPHNARSVYHAIMLRGLHDVLAALPVAHPRRADLEAAAGLAVTAIADEQQAAGVTVVCLRELSRHAALVATPDPRLPQILAGQRAAAADRLGGGGTAPGVAIDEAAWWSATGR